MTRNRILTPEATPVDKFSVKIETGDVIKRLQDVVDKVVEVKRLNDALQGQFASGSASWHQCESIDDRLHEIAALLGE